MSDLVGYLASSIVFATFCMRSQRALRICALVSNVAFLCYALPRQLWPIAVLHAALMPVNLQRLSQCRSRRAAGSLNTAACESGAPVGYAV